MSGRRSSVIPITVAAGVPPAFAQTIPPDTAATTETYGLHAKTNFNFNREHTCAVGYSHGDRTALPSRARDRASAHSRARSRAGAGAPAFVPTTAGRRA